MQFPQAPTHSRHFIKGCSNPELTLEAQCRLAPCCCQPAFHIHSATWLQFVAYGQSKTANIWMANEIERRFGAQGLHALSVHPGELAGVLSCKC